MFQAHLINHTPYRLQCGYCDHRSHYPSWIRKHIRNSHAGKPFKYRTPSSTANPTASIFVDNGDSVSASVEDVKHVGEVNEEVEVEVEVEEVNVKPRHPPAPPSRSFGLMRKPQLTPVGRRIVSSTNGKHLFQGTE